MGEVKKEKGKKKRRMLPILLGTAALLLALAADSKYRISVREYVIESSRLPASFEGFKIVQLSDLHGARFGKDNDQLVEMVEREEPDVIALTGDFVEDEGYLPEFAELIERLCGVAPVYYVSGNHEWASGCINELAEVLSESGAVYLRNEYVRLERGGESIVLCGVEDPNGRSDMTTPRQLADKLRSEYPDEYVVFLGHRNYWLERYVTLPVDLILCGHAHGGLIRLPFTDGLIGPGMELLPSFTDGAYEGPGYTMIVSRGLGSQTPLFRFLNNPHIPVVVLQRPE